MSLVPLATALHAIRASLQFVSFEKLETGAVHEQVEPDVGTAIRDLDRQRFPAVSQRSEIMSRPFRPTKRRRRTTLPTVRLSGSLNNSLTDRRNWIAVFEKTGVPFMQIRPSHFIIQPDQRTIRAFRFSIVFGPIRGAVAKVMKDTVAAFNRMDSQYESFGKLVWRQRVLLQTFPAKSPRSRKCQTVSVWNFLTGLGLSQ